MIDLQERTAMTATLRVAVLLGTAVAFGHSGNAAQAAFAIAFNASSGKAAAYNGSWDLDIAKRQALGNCGSGCRIIASGKKTCAAVVESISTGTSAWAVGYGTTTSVAENQGWHGCRQKGGVTCKTAAAICD
jgi:Domain of unknown function (DUF4189)